MADPIPQTTRRGLSSAHRWFRRTLIVVCGATTTASVLAADQPLHLLGVAALVGWSWSSTHAE